MTEMTVGGMNRYMLLTKHQDGSVDFQGVTLHDIRAVLMSGMRFAKDAEDFECYDGSKVYMLVRGNVLVPEIKIKVGDVEVTP